MAHMNGCNANMPKGPQGAGRMNPKDFDRKNQAKGGNNVQPKAKESMGKHYPTKTK